MMKKTYFFAVALLILSLMSLSSVRSQETEETVWRQLGKMGNRDRSKK